MIACLYAMSPILLKYLGNMGVRSFMSIFIVLNNDVWGLIACHECGERGIRASPPVRELCGNVGACAATNIERLVMQQRVRAQKTLIRAP